MMKCTFCSILCLSVLLLSCASRPADENISAGLHDPPRTESQIVHNDLKGGLGSLKGKKVGALVIFNLPDSYLLRAKSKIFPPDSALKEVLALQSDRSEWLSEAVVTQCEGCGEIEISNPSQILSEELLLRLMDHISLKQPVTEEEWDEIGKFWPGQDYIWLILGTQDYEQRRGLTQEKGLVAAWSESVVSVRSLVREMKSKRKIHEAMVVGHDEDLILYQQVNLPESGQPVRARTVPFRGGRMTSWAPSPAAFDHSMFDQVYPYPPVPEAILNTQKTFLRLAEMLSAQ